MIVVIIGNGQSTAFWHASWLDGKPFATQYPHLYSHVTPDNISVAECKIDGGGVAASPPHPPALRSRRRKCSSLLSWSGPLTRGRVAGARADSGRAHLLAGLGAGSSSFWVVGTGAPSARLAGLAWVVGFWPPAGRPFLVASCGGTPAGGLSCAGTALVLWGGNGAEAKVYGLLAAR
ncbi:hypothetical protein C2845_PM10G15930 [Panicum miliaceum]|uniref:Uncharacterized protein n=1 Tax=Panicum miliaceum TaxID=4540 RepID=A0A3L6PD36_PANMI|nr:hypothetical protein C2845_PM10G15930 [Panicum miliaceum]